MDIETAFREERPRALATLIRLLGDFDLAEDMLQEAFAAALVQWPSSGAPLNPSAWLVSTATTVRVKNGKTLTTDGPFAETREQLGGYYLVEAKNLDEAIALAAGIPASRTGSIEVRPIMPTPPVE